MNEPNDHNGPDKDENPPEDDARKQVTNPDLPISKPAPNQQGLWPRRS